MRIAPLLMLIGAATALAIAAPALGTDLGNCPSPTAYAGAGTSGDPLLVSTPGNLQQFRDTSGDWGKYALLTTDIEMAGCIWGSTFGAHLVAFTGTFDGGGHVVSGLSIATSSSEPYAGFIGLLGTNGVMQDLGFTGDVTVAVAQGSDSATGYAGGLVGLTYSSTMITRSWASGQVSGTAVAVDSGGGIGGSGSGYADASVVLGGIAGYSQGTVADAYFTGSLTGVATATESGVGAPSASVYGGGIAGVLGQGSISNVYSTASTPIVSANATGGASQVNQLWSGGLLGASHGTMSNAFWDATAWPGNGSGYTGPAGTGTTAAGLATFATFGPAGGNWSITNGFPGSTTWGMCPLVNGGRPFLARFEPSSTCTAAPDAPATGPSPSGTSADTGGAVVSPAPLPTHIRVPGPFVTTGTVPSGATSVVQIATGGAASMSRLGLGRWANARVVTRCPITAHGATRTFTCTTKLGPGRWTLSTQARNGATVVASSVRRVVVKAAKPAAVTG